MIQVYIAKNNGFCKGVENAVNTARKIAGEGVYILGDLIHNDCVVKELEGAIQPSFHMYKKNEKGTYDLRGFYLVNEERAAAINKKALQQAADEMGIARKYADEVSEFVNDGINNLKQ